MPGLHAILSASSAKRWLACPPSARLEEKLKGIFGDASSPYAREGTQAHAVAELKLRREIGEINDFSYREQRKLLGDIPREMDIATDDYVDVVISKLYEARRSCPDARLFIEQRLDFSDWVPKGFGTGDAVIVSDTVLDVNDLKYGKGVRVTAVENPQARLYGLGALAEFGSLYDFPVVRNTIIQPRVNEDPVTSEVLTREELLAWGESIKPTAQIAWRGDGEFKPGDHCKFCAAKAICAARAAEASERRWNIYDVFNTLAASATARGAIDNTAATKDNAYELFLNGQEYLGNRNVSDKGRVCFCSYRFANLLKQDSAFMKYGDASQQMLIKGVIGEVDGCKIVKVPSSRLPAGAAFLLTHPVAATAPKQLEDYKIHDNPPGISGWLVEGRLIYDCFVLNEKADAIFYCGAQPVLKTLNVTTAATDTGKSTILVNPDVLEGSKRYYKTATDTSGLIAVTYSALMNEFETKLERLYELPQTELTITEDVYDPVEWRYDG